MKPFQVIEMLAEQVRGRYPVPSGVIAQLIIEVGFQLKTPKDMSTGKESYNLGNIKGVGPAGSVTILTREHYTPAQVEAARRAGTLIKVIGPDSASPGKSIVQVKDKFRAYRNYGEAIEDHYALLKKPRYVNAGLWKAKTPLEYATALSKAGYATDTRYVDKIMSIVDKYQLRRFDVAIPDRATKLIPVTLGKNKFTGRLLDALTWVPARAITEAAGGSVGWNGKEAIINGTALPTRLIEGSSFVPVRRLASALKINCRYDGTTVSLA